MTWRALREGDFDALYALYKGWEAELELPYRTSKDELRHEVSQPDMDLDRDTLVAEDAGGNLLVSAWINAKSREGVKHRAFVTTAALDVNGHLEAHAIDWAVARARERFASVTDELPKVVRAFAASTSGNRIARYEAAGFEVVRYFVEMARSLAEPPPEPKLPAHVELVEWAAEFERSAHDAHVESFADHWGSIPPSWEEFRHRLGWPHTRLDLSVVAVADGRVVSFAINGVYPHDFPVRGRSEGWIESLGTRRAWRRKGLASSLISESLRRFAAEGLEFGVLDVDAANPTGAFGLYERLGFVEESRSVSLMRELGTTI